MRKLYLTLLIILFSTAIHAQSVKLEWANRIGGTGDDRGYSITTDAISGHVYITGRYQGTADFDFSADTFNLTSNGSDDVFIQKLDASGNLVWAKSVGGISADVGHSITTDASGNLYVTGVYFGTVDFDPGANNFILTSRGWGDAFVLKLDADGNFIWARSMGGSAHYDDGISITTDGSGNVYVTGTFHDTADFDPGANTFDLISNGNSDVFILKLDAGGNFIWAKSMGDTLWDDGNSITSDASGNMYIAGSYWGTVDFDPGPATFNLTSKGVAGVDIFIQKLDAGGNFVWARSMGGTFADKAYSITADATGNLYVTGIFQGTADFDPGPDTFNLTTSRPTGFIQKLDEGGNFIWAKSLEADSGSYSSSITIDALGNVYTAGQFGYTADFDPGSDTFNLTAIAGFELFVLKLDTGGNFIWARAMGGSALAYCTSITTDASGNVYATGFFDGIADFDPSTNNFYLSSQGSFDVFILKLSSTVGIEKKVSFSRVSIFPNPNDGIINIDLGDLKEVSVKVFSVLGQLIYHKENINSSIHQFELSEAAGVYIIELSAQGKKQQYKVVKE